YKARANGESDPSRLIINASMRMMADLKDQFGHPSQTPDEALELTLQTFGAFFPKTVAEFQADPTHIEALEAAKQARIAWQNADDTNYTIKNFIGTVNKKDKRVTYTTERDGSITKHWLSRDAYRDDLMASLRKTFTKPTDNTL